MKTPANRSLVALLAAALLFPALPSAQVPTPRSMESLNFNQAPPAPVPSTLQRALEDAKDPEAEIRRGALMILSKYDRFSVARSALAKGLEDPQLEVRRAAAVALVEILNALGPMEAMALIRALSDADAEVRLTAASVLSQCLILVRMMPLGALPGDALPNASDIRPYVIAALNDADPRIRINAVQALPLLRTALPLNELVALMDDPEASVRLATAPIVLRLIRGQASVDALLARHPDPDPLVRKAIAESLARNSAAGPLLDRLAADKDPEVALQASLSRFQLRPQSPLPKDIFHALKHEKFSPEQLDSFFASLTFITRSEALAITRQLLDLESDAIRAGAIDVFLNSLEEPPPADFLIRLLDDNSSRIRREALLYCRRNAAQLEASVVTALSMNAFADMRAQSLDLAEYHSESLQINTALRLMIDDQPSIRLQALRLLADIEPPNWPSLFKAALRDQAPAVRQTAIRLLFGHLAPEGIDVARQFVEEFPQHPSALAIRSKLAAAATP
jgi:HEAT repeat protein